MPSSSLFWDYCVEALIRKAMAWTQAEQIAKHSQNIETFELY